MSKDQPGGNSPEKSSLRRSHQRATEQRILDAALRLIERGEAVTMRGCAVEAAIAERTIYRHFPSREALAEAVRAEIAPRAGVPLPDDIDGLERYACALFSVFENNAALIVGLTTSPQLRGDFRRSRSANLEAMRALFSKAFPGADPAARDAAASALRVLLSGAGWAYLRHYCDMPSDAIIAHARWTVRTLVDRVRTGPAADPSDAADAAGLATPRRA